MSGYRYIQVCGYPAIGNGERSSPMVPAGITNAAFPSQNGLCLLSVNAPNGTIMCVSTSSCDMVLTDVIGWR